MFYETIVPTVFQEKNPWQSEEQGSTHLHPDELVLLIEHEMQRKQPLAPTHSSVVVMGEDIVTVVEWLERCSTMPKYSDSNTWTFMFSIIISII
ncbi:hypothetical protein AVEN_71827-1 [Araneus ventricosus]|uniref:Uncharacterized protein n=1 Tax=Araneus ventricosus TaxID=182803 RepID=A0A4Y2LGZ3_ARAVE|nr:hypothetical protein AVEN_71827-1 [Araneus ventricosus]